MMYWGSQCYLFSKSSQDATDTMGMSCWLELNCGISIISIPWQCTQLGLVSKILTTPLMYANQSNVFILPACWDSDFELSISDSKMSKWIAQSTSSCWDSLVKESIYFICEFNATNDSVIMERIYIRNTRIQEACVEREWAWRAGDFWFLFYMTR